MLEIQELCLISHFKSLAEDKIQSVKDNSGHGIKRIRIVFKNGHELSMAQGIGIYSDSSTNFEIALINKDKELDGSLFDEEDQGDDVLGHCPIEKINHYILKLGELS